MASDDELRALGQPSAEGLSRLVDALGLADGRSPTAVRRLTGGRQAVSHALRLESLGWVVLKRWPNPDAGAATGEVARLRFASSRGLHAPSPLTADPDGAWFGCPAIVMSHLSGKVVYHAQAGPWIDRMADTLAEIHDAALPTSLGPSLSAPHAALAWQPLPPERFPRTGRLGRLLDTVDGLQRDFGGRLDLEPAVFLHHDFRQDNVLWHNDRVSGVVDWHDARVGPAASDVAYATVDLVRTNGIRAANRFVAAYTATRGLPDDLPRWQALWLASQLPWMHRWTTVRPPGGRDLTRETVTRRLRAFADKIQSEI